MLATTLGRSCLAKVPPGWAAATVAAAARMNSRAARIAVGEIVSATATALARKSLHAMLWTQLRTAVASVAFVIALVGMGLGVGAYRQEKAGVPQAPVMENSRTRTEAAKAPANTETPAGVPESFTYEGRVLDPDGKPFAGAKLFLAHFRYHEKSNARVALPAMPRADFASPSRKATSKLIMPSRGLRRRSPRSLMGSVRAGPIRSMTRAELWAHAFRERAEKVDPRNLTIRLARDNAAVSGRIVDLQGRPLAGVSFARD